MTPHSFSNYFNAPLFTLGFRIFFLLASLSALVLLIVWQQFTQGTLTNTTYFANTYWHAHEMLLGYSVAVIAGFLLTAASNWTGKITLQGEGLIGLSLLWLYGRILPFYAGLLPNELIALVDFAFLPALTFVVGRALLQAKNYRNLAFVGLLSLLTLSNAFIHAQMLGLSSTSAAIGVNMALATIVLMILFIAGRVFPFFIERGLKGVIVPRSPMLDYLSVGSAVVFFGLQCSVDSGVLLGLVALIAAALNTWRLVRWSVYRIRFVPLLWILYLGYSWLIVGFVLTALAASNWVSPSLALHAFTLGGIGTLTLGMMARVSLGHTGHPLKASPPIVIAFVLINLAALFRVVMPLTFSAQQDVLFYLATLSWLGAFALFVVVYLPLLTKKRGDEQ
ncbi:MAG: hypothetical protein RL755_1957 [Pseudomonadota bacterium]|jgi:uncharacterized protein involved in response to NO